MFKKVSALLIALVMVISFAACGGNNNEEPTNPADTTAEQTTVEQTTAAVIENATIRLATTTSVNDSGLLPYLQPYFEAASGYKLEIASAGTGVAIGYAKAGDADLLLVHSKSQEEAFIADGYASERLPFMFNFFVIVGPEADPAGVKDCTTAADAFKAISEAKATFISRGDESGTHNKEISIWKNALGEDNLPAADTDTWYVSSGTGMGATLTMASEQSAYTLTDKATYLNNKDSLELGIVLAESDDMKNTYSLIAVDGDSANFAGTEVDINEAGAQAFIDWMLTAEAKALIEAYGIDTYGAALFQTVAAAYGEDTAQTTAAEAEETTAQATAA